MIYLDNAATSWPKPPEVSDSMQSFLAQAAGNPGRSAHKLSVDAARIIYDTRESVAKLFNINNPLRIVFTLNATHALNIALLGLLKPGDQVLTTSVEHNSVMRPLRALEQKNIGVRIFDCCADGTLDIVHLKDELTMLRPKLVVINHASNVAGTLQDVKEIARITHESGALILVDAAQTAGVIPIDLHDMGIDLLAFSGHKGLLGPTGTGGLVIGENVDTSLMEPIIFGGTGSMSEYELQPEDLPDKFESGTPNSVGIAGLGAGVKFIMNRGIDKIRKHEVALTRMLIDGLASLERIRVYGTRDAKRSTGVISFTIDGMSVSDIGRQLEEDAGILSRVGLHCAPSAHKTIGTFPHGTVRLSPGIYTTPEDISKTIDTIGKIATK